MSARGLKQRLKALEGNKGSQHTRCVLWWPGQRWADAVAAAPGAGPIRPSDPVQVIRFIAAGAGDDPVQAEEQPIADAWLAAREAPCQDARR